ncbi:DnaJ domain-containing protein [Xylaria longipes]|nr:DnaJ domain-containing protein [Xylaria longipes]RYC58025.1 hypothetical protein CHU98_g8194 [Xylaria longipes]
MNEAIDPPSTPDYYRDLGVTQTASLEAIRQAFKQLALATHPDKNLGESNDAAGFRKAHEAYMFLSDPQKRANYDVFYLVLQRQWAEYYRWREAAARSTEEAETKKAALKRDINDHMWDFHSGLSKVTDQLTDLHSKLLGLYHPGAESEMSEVYAKCAHVCFGYSNVCLRLEELQRTVGRL